MNRLACLALTSLAACSVVPERRHPTVVEHEVAVFYDLQDSGGADLRVPASGQGLTVLEFRTEPLGVLEIFEGGERRLRAQGDSLTVLCRYRLFRPLDDSDAATPLPSPEQLFPGATSIRRLDSLAK